MDYKTLKKQELEAILQEKAIPYKASATKPELLALLEESEEAAEKGAAGEEENPAVEGEAAEAAEENSEVKEEGPNKPSDEKTRHFMHTKKPKERRQRRRYGTLYVDAADKHAQKISPEQNARMDIMQAADHQKMLTGKIVGTSQAYSGGTSYKLPFLMYGPYKVIFSPTDILAMNPSEIKERTINTLMDNRIGSEIDFYVKKGIVQEEGLDSFELGKYIVAGDRLGAMRKKRQDYWGQIEKKGYTIREGTAHEARVVTAVKDGIFVELFGVETMIPNFHLDFTKILDAREFYHPGMKVKVIVTSVNREDPRGILTYTASIRELRRDDRAHIFEMINKGDYMRGRVVRMLPDGQKSACLVRLEMDKNGYDCYCTLEAMIPIVGQNVKVKIVNTYNDRGQMRVTGRVVHVEPLLGRN